MRVGIVGAGGREHALCYVLGEDPRVTDIFVYPGSDAIGELPKVHCRSVKAIHLADSIVRDHLRFVVIGPEEPLMNGLADELRRRGVSVIGPSQHLAQLEGSKGFAKAFMSAEGIPTARSWQLEGTASLATFLESWNWAEPLVIKADGLAAGKGVIIARSLSEGRRALEDLKAHRAFVVEEFIEGREVSLTVLVSDGDYILFPPVQDHKQRFENGRGPNTGGMGTVSPPRWWTPEYSKNLEATIVRPSVEGIWKWMRDSGSVFRGVLFIGVMVNPVRGGFVLEYNVRFGDPETQCLSFLFKGSWSRLFEVLSGGGRFPLAMKHQFSNEAAAFLVAVQRAYPYDLGKSTPILDGLDSEGGLDSKQIRVFHSGTLRKDGQWYARGGRVLGIGVKAPNLTQCLIQLYKKIGFIRFRGMDYRRDLGKN